MNDFTFLADKILDSKDTDISETSKNEDVKPYLEIAKKACEEQLNNYSNDVQNKFKLSDEEANKLDDFFKNSYIIVIKTLLEHYKVSIDGKRKGNKFEFHINVPVVTTNTLLTPAQIEYLTMKYYEIFEELSLYELGFNSIKILKKYWPSNTIPSEVKLEEEKYSYSYVLNVSCLIKKMFFDKTKVLLLEKDKHPQK